MIFVSFFMGCMNQTILQQFSYKCGVVFDGIGRGILDNSELRAEYLATLEIFSGKRVLQLFRIHKN